MRMQRAMEIINRANGFMVAFEVKESGVLRGDCFPDKDAGEALIPIEEAAWDLAEKFAMHTIGKVYNVYVVDNAYNPVDKCRIYNPYPWERGKEKGESENIGN